MRVLFVSLTLALGLCAAPSATVLLPAEFREIVSGSQVIVHGRVIDVRSDWVDGGTRIESAVTIESATFFRGAPVATVTFRTPGGEVGPYRNVMVGAPVFRVGDEAVWFLKAHGTALHIFGLNQGLFRVRIDARTGRRLVIRQPLISRGAAAERITRGDTTRRPLTLDAFGAEVRAALQRGAGQ
jgi:hypothetical protein